MHEDFIVLNLQRNVTSLNHEKDIRGFQWSWETKTVRYMAAIVKSRCVISLFDCIVVAINRHKCLCMLKCT